MPRHLMPLLALTLAGACAPALVISTGKPTRDQSIEQLMVQLAETGHKQVTVIVSDGYLDETESEILERDREDPRVNLEVVEPGGASIDAALSVLEQDQAQAVMPFGDASTIHLIVARLQSLGLANPVLLWAPDELGHMVIKRVRVLPVLRTVMGIERPEDEDLLVQVNGETLRGLIVNDPVTVATTHGVDLEIPIRRIAAIVFGNESRDTVITVNGNEIFGAVADREIAIDTMDSGRMTLDHVSKLVLRVRENELDGLQRNTVFVMNGGDVLSGKVDSSVIKVEAKEPGEGEVDPALMRNVASGTGYVASAVRESIAQGDTEYRTGVLVGDRIEVALDLGPTVGLARDDVQTIFFRAGYADVIGPHDEDLAFALPDARARDWRRGPPIIVGDLGLELARLEPASFAMGWPEFAEPVHTAKITRPYYLGVTEVTRKQWRAIMADPSTRKGDDLPVTNVSWEECQEFCRRLTDREHHAGHLPDAEVYRLPSEAQWEYACRAGTDGLFAGKLIDMGWFAPNSLYDEPSDRQGKLHRVAQKMPNAWGFYDMYGNVYEYCSDRFGRYTAEAVTDPEGPAEGEPGLVRGGSWSCPSECCNSVTRAGYGLGVHSDLVGFRVARCAR